MFLLLTAHLALAPTTPHPSHQRRNITVGSRRAGRLQRRAAASTGTRPTEAEKHALLERAFLAALAHDQIEGAVADHDANAPTSEARRRGGQPEEHDARPGTDEPMRAILWRRRTQVDEHGRIPQGAWLRAVAQRRQNLFAHALRPMTTTPPKLTWTERGPSNVTGRSRAFLIHPTQTNRMWTAGVGGGIWYSSDSGATWNPADDTMATLAIGCMAFDPRDPSIMYAGTGEGYFNIDGLNGAGVFKSTDSGVTWAPLASTSKFSAINRIVVSPVDSKTLFISTLYGGIYRSSDGGATWTNVKSAQVGMAIAIDPHDATRMICSVLDYDSGAQSWFYQTLFSIDSGKTWTQATGDIGKITGFGSRVELAYAPKTPGLVYASCAASGGVVYKSTDGGKSYAKVTTSGASQASWYCNAIWVDPTNSSFLVVSGTATFKSTDGGATLTQISAGYILTQEPHPDDHYLVAAPGFDGVKVKSLYVTSDGGPFRTNDIYNASQSSGWSAVGGQRTTQYYAAAGDGQTGLILGGLQDNGTLLTQPGANDASMEFGGDGGFCAIDWTDPSYMYGEYIDLEIHRSIDGGASSDFIFNGANGSGALSDAGTNANFIAPFILDPNNVDRLVAGGASLWVSNNAKASAPTWSAIRTPGTDLVSAIAVAPGSSDTIWVGQNDGGIDVSTNGTAAAPTWKHVSTRTAGPLPARYVTRIAIDPRNISRVFVAFGGYTSNNLWSTADGGATWKPISGSGSSALPQAPVRGIALDPIDTNTLYVGTDVGVYASADAGATWSADPMGPANVSVDELTFMSRSNTLLAATHGRGIWTAERPSLATFNLAPSGVSGGTAATGTVTLKQAAPANGVLVRLASDNSCATPPATVSVPAGKSSVSFSVDTTAVRATSVAHVTAQVGNTSATQPLNVNAAFGLLGVSSSPTAVVGGARTTGTVTLDEPAPSGGIVVTLKSSSALTVPTSVSIAAGASTATFSVQTHPVAAATQATITAQYKTQSVSTTVTVNPDVMSGIAVTPASLVGSLNGAVVVTLQEPAATGGFAVSLTSSSAMVSVPATALVPAGKASYSFAIGSKPVYGKINVTITAKAGGVVARAALALLPVGVVGVSASPASVRGGTSSTGTITLQAPAGPAAITVRLSSSNAVVSVPATVTVPAGSRSVTFVITTQAVSANTTATISAAANSTVQSTRLTVTP